MRKLTLGLGLAGLIGLMLLSAMLASPGTALGQGALPSTQVSLEAVWGWYKGNAVIDEIQRAKMPTCEPGWQVEQHSPGPDHAAWWNATCPEGAWCVFQVWSNAHGGLGSGVTEGLFGPKDFLQLRAGGGVIWGFRCPGSAVKNLGKQARFNPFDYNQFVVGN